ncbi:hypothetical protein EDC04DRAFT_3135665 [Pisolithus marmoratus]|nr:hypothetical protein EDC04DRAFT_3135665 [Pisolithus marmoratus]
MSVGQPSTSVSSNPPRSRLSNETAKYRPRTSRDSQPRANSPPSLLARRKDASARAEDLVDEDPFASLYSPNPSLCRRSSRLSRWLADLPNRSGLSTPSDIDDFSHVDPVGTRCNPYLAYPHLATAPRSQTCEDTASTHDYVLIDGGEAETWQVDQPVQVKASHRAGARRCNDSTINDSTLECCPPTTQFPPLNTSLQLLQCRRRRHVIHPDYLCSTSHLAQIPAPRRASTPEATSNPLQVPDNRFLSPSDNTLDRSRPSMSSSTNTFSSTPTAATKIHDHGDSPIPSSTPSKASSIFGSIRSRADRSRTSSQPPSKSDIRISSPSAWSQPRSSLNLPAPQDLSRTIARKASVLRLPFTNKPKPGMHSAANQPVVEEQGSSQPHVLYTSRGSAPRVSLSSISSQPRKKRLVVSGIALNDSARVQAVQRWCESFGEVDQITRMPNGDLHVNFRKAEVADMVCRVRARVQIAGVGSVQLSWTYRHKRS